MPAMTDLPMAAAGVIENAAHPDEGVCGMLILKILAAWSAIAVITALLAGEMIRRMGRDHIGLARGNARARAGHDAVRAHH